MKKEQSYASHCHEEKVAFYLLSYGLKIKRKNIKEKKAVLEELILLS